MVLHIEYCVFFHQKEKTSRSTDIQLDLGEHISITHVPYQRWGHITLWKKWRGDLMISLGFVAAQMDGLLIKMKTDVLQLWLEEFDQCRLDQIWISSNFY